MAKSIYEDNISFFEETPETKPASNKIDVVKLTFDGAESVEWRELFEGYNKLYPITFSSRVNFVNQLLSTFDYAEIIFGYFVYVG